VRAEFIIYLNKLGKEGGLVGFEQIKNIMLDPEGFMPKGILTNTMKIQRHLAKVFYMGVIENLYKEGMLKTDKK